MNQIEITTRIRRLQNQIERNILEIVRLKKELKYNGIEDVE